METISFAQMKEAFSPILENLKKHREYLNDLDSPIGDSDHGESVCKAFARVKEAIDNLPGDSEDIGLLLTTAGKTILFSGGKAREGEKSLKEAISATRKGMESTKDMLARRGRSSRLGERILGHIDPGAASSYSIIEAWFGVLLGG